MCQSKTIEVKAFFQSIAILETFMAMCVHTYWLLNLKRRLAILYQTFDFD